VGVTPSRHADPPVTQTYSEMIEGQKTESQPDIDISQPTYQSYSLSGSGVPREAAVGTGQFHFHSLPRATVLDPTLVPNVVGRTASQTARYCSTSAPRMYTVSQKNLQVRLTSGQICKIFMSNFLRLNLPKIIEIG